MEWGQDTPPRSRTNKSGAERAVNNGPATNQQIDPLSASSFNSTNGASSTSTNIPPSTVHKTPAGRRPDLPSWLMEQPTQFDIPVLRPSSLTGTGHTPATPLPAEWQPASSATWANEQSSHKPGSNRPLHRQSSPEWQPPEATTVSQLKSNPTDSPNLPLPSLATPPDPLP